MANKSLIVLALFLASCDSSEAEPPETVDENLVVPVAAPEPKTIAERIKEGDPTICAEPAITGQAMTMFRDAVETIGSEYAEADDLTGAMRKVDIKLSAVSTAGIDGTTGQIDCDAEIVASNGDSERSNRVSYIVRPALREADGEFIFRFSDGKDALLETAALVVVTARATAQARFSPPETIEDDDSLAVEETEPTASDVQDALLEAQEAVENAAEY